MPKHRRKSKIYGAGFGMSRIARRFGAGNSKSTESYLRGCPMDQKEPQNSSSSPIPDPELPTLIAQRESNLFWSKCVTWARNILIACLVVAVVLLSYGYFDGKRAVRQLADQRQQFVYCQDLPKGTPGCEKPVTPKQDVTGDRPALKLIPGPAGATPSDSKLMLVFARYCSERADRCRGENGTSVSRAQVATMIKSEVAAYCADDRCKGDPGDTGATGPAGADSTVPGPEGPAGPPGPSCPTGYVATSTQILTSEGVKTATLCLEE